MTRQRNTQRKLLTKGCLVLSFSFRGGETILYVHTHTHIHIHVHTDFSLIFKILCELAMPNSTEPFLRKGKKWSDNCVYFH